MDHGNNKNEASSDAVDVVRLPNTGAHEILRGRLYLGPGGAASDEAALKADGITHVLNIAREIPMQKFSSGVEVCHLQCRDSPHQKLPFREAVAFVDRCLDGGDCGMGKCLVHCNAGQSRSASAVMYYLMTKRWTMTLKESYEYVKKRKPDILPNYGFISQLQEEEAKLFGGKISLDMNEYKADTLCYILEGARKTREDVIDALKKANGNGDIALGMLLE